jgi:hypothetical protein
MAINTGKLRDMLTKEHYASIQGKEYILLKGLLLMAHEAGFRGMQSEITQVASKENGWRAVAHVTVHLQGEDEQPSIFEACADASVETTKLLAYERMAETRALSRALRFALNWGDVTADEMPDGESARDRAPMQQPTRAQSPPESPREKPEPGARPSDAPPGTAPQTAGEGTQQVCADCRCSLTRGQVTSAVRSYGVALCMECRKKHQPLEAA